MRFSQKKQFNMKNLESLIFEDNSFNEFNGNNMPEADQENIVGKYISYHTRIYDRVLTSNDIFLLYNNRKINIFDKIKSFIKKCFNFLR